MTTLAVAQAATGGSTLAMLSEVATIVIAVAMLALVLVALSVFVRLNRLLDEMKGVAKDNIGPVSDRAKIISDNLEFITQALRTDVEKLNASVRALSDRLHHASERMEERVEDFNALMEVVQGEAEELFLDTASTVRGVRAGARQIASPERASTGERRSSRPAPKPEHVRGTQGDGGPERVDEFDLGPDGSSSDDAEGDRDTAAPRAASPADAGA